jgi:tetratricopeptide (TPR) repeat protein
VPKPRPAGSISRRPGESADAARAREAALHTRYGYSKAALERGDYAAATGGFEAILLEEPGFLDAPRLLVQAQAGLRASARALFDAADRLDRAGDWVGALLKYEQAKQVHAGLAGIDGRIARARQRLQAAGAAAFSQARVHDAAGRVDDAIREYEKAIQWLPADDPNRQTARSRVEQLRKRN